MLSSKLEKYKKLLNVQNWQIQLIEEECLDCDGHTKMLYNDYRAVIKISKSLSDTEKELSLIHELLHLVHRDEYFTASEVLDTAENKFVNTMYVRFHERSIEQMAKIIYKLSIIGGV